MLSEDQLVKFNNFLKNKFFVDSEIFVGYDEKNDKIEITGLIFHFYVNGKKSFSTKKIMLDYYG